MVCRLDRNLSRRFLTVSSKITGYAALLHYLETLLSHYGYGVIGVVVMLEAMGLPLPAESLLIAASLFSATTHKLHITGIVLAGVSGAVMGDNFGYLIGKKCGFRLLQHYGKYVGLNRDRILLGRYIFRERGGVVVFFGRFVAIMRLFVALLGGANRMHWRTFLIYNALGGVCWAGGYSLGAYYLGQEALRISGPIAWSVASLGALTGLAGFLFLKKNERRLTQQAMTAARNDPELAFGMEQELKNGGPGTGRGAGQG